MQEKHSNFLIRIRYITLHFLKIIYLIIFENVTHYFISLQIINGFIYV